MAYAPGLLFFSFYKALTPAFYGMQDLKTPLKVSLIGVILNITLNITSVILLPQAWKHVGIALSTVVTSLFNTSILYVLLKKRIGGVSERRLFVIFIKALTAALLMAFVAYRVHAYLYLTLPGFIQWEKAVQILSVLCAVASGALIYALVLAVFCRKELSKVISVVLKLRNRNQT